MYEDVGDVVGVAGDQVVGPAGEYREPTVEGRRGIVTRSVGFATELETLTRRID
jgi:hypothetical protein